MAADNIWSGRVTITPPLTWAECKLSPGVEDVKLDIHEEDGPDGWIFTAVAVVPARSSNSWSAHTGSDLQVVIDAHPTHEFAGSLRVDWDPRIGGDVLAERYEVRVRRVVHLTARLAWTEDALPEGGAPERDTSTLDGRDLLAAMGGLAECDVVPFGLPAVAEGGDE